MLRIAIALLASILAVAFTARAADLPAPTSRPNIILIFSDDVGLGDMHCTGGPFKTPHIDALAAGGMRFEYCYSTPLCGPSRCELLTGRYPFRTGLISNQQPQRDPARPRNHDPHRPEEGRLCDRQRGQVGADVPRPGRVGLRRIHRLPRQRPLLAQADRRTTPSTASCKTFPPGKYLPDIMHQFLVDFIARHKHQPFFVYYPMSHIHGPIVPTPDSKPGATKDQLMPTTSRTWTSSSASWCGTRPAAPAGEDAGAVHRRQRHGPVRRGAATVNGRQHQRHEGPDARRRQPRAVDRQLARRHAGRQGESRPDRLQRLLRHVRRAGRGEAARRASTLDSHSFAAQIRGEKGSPREWVYVELNGKSYVRDARFKLTGDGELFDLAEAPFKEIPVAKDATDPAAAAARKKLQAVLDQHKAAPWTPPRRQRNGQALIAAAT